MPTKNSAGKYLSPSDLVQLDIMAFTLLAARFELP